MARILFIIIILSSTFISCYDIDEDIIPIVGVYRAHVIGFAGPFDLIVGTAGGDDVIIEAPFVNDNWITVKADINNMKEPVMNINIKNQQINVGLKIKGSGFYKDGTIELKYTLESDGDKKAFTIIGTKY